MKAFVCRCEDVPLIEVEEAIAAGHDDLEALRRYTAIGTGPCQGKSCLVECVRLLAAHHGVDEGTLGLWTMRPPLVPIPLGHLAALDDRTLTALTGHEPPAAPPPPDRATWLKKGGRL